MILEQLDTLEPALLAATSPVTCPCCGTSNVWCRVWAGGPGHTVGMHNARIALAQQALKREFVGLVAESTAPTVAVEMTMSAPVIAKGKTNLVVGCHQQARAA